VSPTYAAEIQQPALGAGLDGVLRARVGHLHGILNGIDTEVWNPGRDPLISTCYDSGSLDRKRDNRRTLRERAQLEPADGPLFGFVGRLTSQKGIDWVLSSAPRWLAQGGQLVVLGRGDACLEAAVAGLAAAHPGRVHAALGFDEPLAHLIEAGADCFLMPSRFEPCGLNQMYSMAYGTPPVVSATGGLADTVQDVGHDFRGGTGFVMEASSQEGFDATMDRVFSAWRHPALWRAIQQRGMSRDFGWRQAARQYEALYERLVSSQAG
jgi:starch synthase